MSRSADKSVTSDSWCTPKWLAELLGEWDVDPCSNANSHILAVLSVRLPEIEAAESVARDADLEGRHAEAKAIRRWLYGDGLAMQWRGSVFVNPPYSNPLPWCERLRDHDGPWAALLKLDPSTRWWATLMDASPQIAPFRKRIKFEGDRAMTANFPSVLVYSAWRPSRELAAHLWLPTYLNTRSAA